MNTWGVSTAAAKKHRAAQRAVRRCIIKTEVGLTAQLAAVIKTLAKRQIAWICLPLSHTHSAKSTHCTQELTLNSGDDVQTLLLQALARNEEMKLFHAFSNDRIQRKATHVCNY